MKFSFEMNSIVESPFFKVFATTNSLLLGAGAVYLVSFGKESASLKTTNHDEGRITHETTCRKHAYLDEKQYTEGRETVCT